MSQTVFRIRKSGVHVCSQTQPEQKPESVEMSIDLMCKVLDCDRETLKQAIIYGELKKTVTNVSAVPDAPHVLLHSDQIRRHEADMLDKEMHARRRQLRAQIVSGSGSEVITPCTPILLNPEWGK